MNQIILTYILYGIVLVFALGCIILAALLIKNFLDSRREHEAAAAERASQVSVADRIAQANKADTNTPKKSAVFSNRGKATVTSTAAPSFFSFDEADENEGIQLSSTDTVAKDDLLRSDTQE